LKKIKENNLKKSELSDLLKWQVKSRKYYKKTSTQCYWKYIKDSTGKDKVIIRKNLISGLLITIYQILLDQSEK